MFQLIKCHLLDKHINDCWIVENKNKQIKAMCPCCGKLVVKNSKGEWKTYKGVIV